VGFVFRDVLTGENKLRRKAIDSTKRAAEWGL